MYRFDTLDEKKRKFFLIRQKQYYKCVLSDWNDVLSVVSAYAFLNKSCPDFELKDEHKALRVFHYRIINLIANKAYDREGMLKFEWVQTIRNAIENTGRDAVDFDEMKNLEDLITPKSSIFNFYAYVLQYVSDRLATEQKINVEELLEKTTKDRPDADMIKAIVKSILGILIVSSEDEDFSSHPNFEFAQHLLSV